jgi:DMSO reductase family type II enzyme molybdopterin subunit
VDLTRRDLLIAGALSSVALSLRALRPGPLRAAPAPAPTYAGIGDIYRQAWRWDRVVRGTHLRANCFSACAFDLYVREGMVWREEQADVYERDGKGLPDFGPRGCQKGCCYSDLMVNADRVLHPMERVGPRGSGRWRRISWEKALDRVADAMLDAIDSGGAETIVYDNGSSNTDMGPDTMGEMRLFSMLGATSLDGFAGTGDLAMGAFQTWGTSFVDGSSDDWMRADTLLLWHCNPVSTRIPDAHFIHEARYRGTEVITIAPDYSPTAIHASLWVNPRPGSDAALALGLAHQQIELGALDEAYVREQTDLPFLVRADDGRYLRETDLSEGGAADIFYVYDEAGQEIVQAPGTMGRWSDSIELGEIVPALDGTYEVALRDGSRVQCRPVMELLRERLAEYTPERVKEITGIHSGVQRALAERLASSKRTLIYATWGSNKAYHADLMQRAMILLSALRGQQGKAGSGVRFAAWLPFEGAMALIPGAEPSWWMKLILGVLKPGPRMIENAIASRTRAMASVPSHLFLYHHAGLAELQDADAAGDPTLPRPAREYMEQAVERDWVMVRPAPGNQPRVLFMSGVNPLRRWPAPQVVERVLWPKLDLIVSLDFRLSSTGMKSDLVLPAAGYYEKSGIKYAVALVPYTVVGERAVPPLGESKSEWNVMAMLAEAIERRARKRGVEGELASFGQRFLENGRYQSDGQEQIIDEILQTSSPTRGTGWAEARRRGAIPMKSIGGWSTLSGVGSDVEEGGTLAPSRIHVEGKSAWPTLTGRQQFYLDHQWFREADEMLPRWKPLPMAGGEHPILLTGGHERWSIHAIWRAHPDLLRLQRGEPVMWMAVEDARRRNIEDADRVRVFNDHGAFEIMVKVAAVVAPGEAIVYHAWEPHQFPGWRGNMEVVSSPYKPVHLVGDYGHLRLRMFSGGPMHVPRGVPVQIEGLEKRETRAE